MTALIQKTMLSTHDLAIGFASGIVANDISLSVEAGEILVIAGPNGVGKSTLSKTIARLIEPLAGEVKIDGINIKQLSTQAFAQKVAYVSQIPDATSTLTVTQLVMLGRNPHQKWWQWQGSENDQRIVDSILTSTALSDLKDKSMDHLSGGERQRVYLAVALAQQPSFLILDEPTAFLDFKHQLELIDLLKRLSAQGIGIIMVLHDLNLTKRLASKVLLMQKNENAPGTIKALGAPDKVLSTNILQEVFNVTISSATDATSGREFIFFDSL
ncbi:MAG: ABC transporter ATP-binding protein [Candidatus Obscuribacterales bacterium]|nr:ABC transporter ATP-binding protein [Candidatus Obscuribacterales bacterium]